VLTDVSDSRIWPTEVADDNIVAAKRLLPNPFSRRPHEPEVDAVMQVCTRALSPN
jgi:hypothetical protein